MAYTSHGRFEGEPWYVGVWSEEAGERFPGWFWYKTHLQMRKETLDRTK